MPLIGYSSSKGLQNDDLQPTMEMMSFIFWDNEIVDEVLRSLHKREL